MCTITRACAHACARAHAHSLPGLAVEVKAPAAPSSGRSCGGEGRRNGDRHSRAAPASTVAAVAIGRERTAGAASAVRPWWTSARIGARLRRDAQMLTCTQAHNHPSTQMQAQTPGLCVRSCPDWECMLARMSRRGSTGSASHAGPLTRCFMRRQLGAATAKTLSAQRDGSSLGAPLLSRARSRMSDWHVRSRRLGNNCMHRCTQAL